MKNQFTSAIPDDLRKNLRLGVQRAAILLQRAKFARTRAPAGGWPVLMANYFPKSGSQLLDQALTGFSRVGPFSAQVVLPFSSYAGSGRKRSLEAALAYVHALHPLDVTSALLLAWPEVVAEVCTPKFIPFIIFSDPRDIVISHVFHFNLAAAGTAGGQEHRENLSSFDERLKISILGRPDDKNEFPNIARRFELYQGWMDRPQVLVLRYEDFILERHATLGRVVDHFLKRVDTLPLNRDQIIAALEANIDSHPTSATRPGRIGEWQKYFKPEHKQMFKDVAGDLLVQLGYEKDKNW